MVGVPTNRTPSMLALHRVLCQRKHEGIVSLLRSWARNEGMDPESSPSAIPSG